MNGSAVAPEWFREAIAHEPRMGRVASDGGHLATREWGYSTPGNSDILLIHGGAAHSGWWDHVAPVLAQRRRVIAFDLSGHGDSTRRAKYSVDHWAAEAQAVIDQAALTAAPVVVGHSLGGIVAAALAHRASSALGGVVVVDSPLDLEPPAVSAAARDVPTRQPRVYATRREALAHFHPIPRQQALPFIAEHIAGQSVQEVDAGWTWKFDAALTSATRDDVPSSYGEGARTLFVIAENGILSSDARASLSRTTDLAIAYLAAAGHAPMLDRPLEFISLMQSQFAEWGC